MYTSVRFFNIQLLQTAFRCDCIMICHLILGMYIAAAVTDCHDGTLCLQLQYCYVHLPADWADTSSDSAGANLEIYE